jgi:hypothetical protein
MTLTVVEPAAYRSSIVAMHDWRSDSVGITWN